jgi:hypothetical protein
MESEALQFWTEDTPAVLAEGIDALLAKSARYREEPGEKNALPICRLTKRIWESIVGMLGEGVVIDGSQLTRAIEAIAAGGRSVDTVPLSPETPQEVTAHVKEMVKAMRERANELTILRDKGESAFRMHLLQRELVRS